MDSETDGETKTGEVFLAALADADRKPIRERTTLVFAHPDDETIACGSILPRLSDVTIIHVTDGAPQDGADAAALGYSGPAEYATARRRELEAAMTIAGVPQSRLEMLGCPDQQAALRLTDLATELTLRLAGQDIVLTHAFEGGHPDHDATAFAVHAACRILGRGRAPAIIEAPLYRAGGAERLEDWEIATFIPDGNHAQALVELTPEERERKQLMFAAHLSQLQVLARFPMEREVFRQAPAYDFARLPNAGNLLYERHDWGMTGERWRDLAQAALFEIELKATP